jgi:hypothetical protein
VIGLLVRVALLDRLGEVTLTVRRMLWHVGNADGRGLVILAVVGPGVEVSKAIHTGLGNDRAKNMVEFARLALEYLLEQLEAENKGKI